MKLVIIESPGKIASFEKALGHEYKIISSVGHCIDLPDKKFSVNLKNNFEPTFEIKSDKKTIFDSIRKLALKASSVYLMTDPDREGHGMAWHLSNELKKTVKAQFYRSATNEITKKSILEAIETPCGFDMNIIDAYLTRRILDRLVGYRSSFLTKQATGGRSAGRVQSAMLRIIVEREKEIKVFIPEEYWVLTAYLLVKDTGSYQGVLDEKIKVSNEVQASEIYNKVIKGNPVITSVESKEASIEPYAPFTTSSLIQASSTIFGWTADKTMKVAQGLYESSFLTYHRTDSPSMADEALVAVRSFIQHAHGLPYLNPTVKTYMAKKGAQEGHECCRPTDISVTNITSSHDAQKMYEMIWKRTVASQMVPGKDRRMKVVTQISGYDFISRGNTVIFDGFRKIWNYSKQQEQELPDLNKGDKPNLLKLEKEQKWTSPPPRYSDASLQKQCDLAQIARPATFASFLKTLEGRGYIKRVKKSFEATDLGIRVVDFLMAAHMCFVDLEFTADMERLLDEVAGGEKAKLEVLTKFWDTLKENIEYGKSIKDEHSKTTHKCPKCDGFLKLKHSNFGAFYSCENYKKKDGCTYVAKVGENGEPIEKVVKEKEYASFVCNLCGEQMIKRSSKFGEFYGCSKYPSCRVTAALDGTFKDSTKKKPSFKKFKKKIKES